MLMAVLALLLGLQGEGLARARRREVREAREARLYGRETREARLYDCRYRRRPPGARLTPCCRGSGPSPGASTPCRWWPAPASSGRASSTSGRQRRQSACLAGIYTLHWY